MMQAIRPIDKQDIPALVDLINESYRNDNEGAWTTEAHLFAEGGKRIDAAEIETVVSDPGNHVLKYEKDGIILGTVTLTEKEEAIYLGTLAVSPLSQGQGIGKKFLYFAKDLAAQKGKKQVTLTVISVRQELIGWYERFGFKMTGNTVPFPAAGHVLSTPKETLFFEEMALNV